VSAAAVKAAFAPIPTPGTFRREMTAELEAVIAAADREFRNGAWQIAHWTPTTSAAARTLNALRHAVIYRLDIAEEIDAMRRRAATDSHRLTIMLDQRRRAWRAFQVLLAEYRNTKEIA
jgi:hypothetical protein